MARNFLQLLGHLAASTFVTQPTRLQFRCFQGWLRTIYILNKHSLDKLMYVPCWVLDSLNWWKDLSKVCAGIPFTQPPSKNNIMSDVSLMRWRHTIQGQWSAQESLLHISFLELRAVKKFVSTSSLNQVPSCQSPDKQCSLRVLHKLSRRG